MIKSLIIFCLFYFIGPILASRDFESQNPADQLYYNPTVKTTNVNYYKDRFESVKQELEELKKKHAKHEPPPYKMGIEYVPTKGDTVNRIRDRGKMICGTYDDVPGFSVRRGESWQGFDIDVCTAVAIAVMGDDWQIEFEEVNGKTRFEKLYDGTVDIISATTTWTYSRDVDWNIEFLPTTYYDGQGFIVRKSLGVRSAKDLAGARVCFNEDTTAAQNIKDFFELWDIPYRPVPIGANDSAADFYIDGECDMFGTDRSALAGKKSTFSNPSSFPVISEADASPVAPP